jgi:protein required for attachment to host cells
MKKVWILVADEAIARILEQPQQGGGDLVSVEELTDPDAHAREAEMRHDAYGRRASGTGASQVTVSASDSERHQHAQLFAARIIEQLAQRRREQRFDTLHIVAAPRLLGYLRKALTPELAPLVVSTQDKDVVQESNADLTRRFAPLLAGSLLS